MEELEEKIRLVEMVDVAGGLFLLVCLFAEFTEGLNPHSVCGHCFFFFPHPTNLAAFNSFCNGDKEARRRAILRKRGSYVTAPPLS